MEAHTLGTLLTELAARGPERPALTCAGRTLAFGELDAAARRSRTLWSATVYGQVTGSLC